MAHSLAITAEVTDLGGKERCPLCLGTEQTLLWCCSVQRDVKSRRDEMKWTKPQQAPHSTQPSAWQQLQPNLLSRSGVSSGNNSWSCPRPVCVTRSGSPDLHWHLGEGRAQKLGFFKCRISKGICGGIGLNYLIRNYNSQEKHGNFHSSVHLDKCPVCRDRCSAGNPIMDNLGRISHKKVFS